MCISAFGESFNAGGAKVAELKNSKGAVLKVKGKQVGLELALDLSGTYVSLEK